jgi:hypothetical protein
MLTTGKTDAKNSERTKRGASGSYPSTAGLPDPKNGGPLLAWVARSPHRWAELSLFPAPVRKVDERKKKAPPDLEGAW